MPRSNIADSIEKNEHDGVVHQPGIKLARVAHSKAVDITRTTPAAHTEVARLKPVVYS